MSKKNENMSLWEKVCKTDPKHTRKANVGGNKITAIGPQYQLMKATEQFGPFGMSWGIKDTSIDYTLMEMGLIVYRATFFYPGGEFPIINSIKLYKDNAQTKIDDDFAKKVETDATTKALSKLGFNADVFMGYFDDSRYVDMMEKEAAKKELKDNWEWERSRTAVEKDLKALCSEVTAATSEAQVVDIKKKYADAGKCMNKHKETEWGKGWAKSFSDALKHAERNSVQSGRFEELMEEMMDIDNRRDLQEFKDKNAQEAMSWPKPLADPFFNRLAEREERL
jgi:hypothetical protein